MQNLPPEHTYPKLLIIEGKNKQRKERMRDGESYGERERRGRGRENERKERMSDDYR